MPSSPPFLSIPPLPSIPSIYLTNFYTSDAPRLQYVLDHPSVNTALIRIPTPYTLAHARDWIALTHSASPPLPFPSVIRVHAPGEEGLLIGTCGLSPKPDEEGSFELGYFIDPEWSGKGIMKQVVRAVVGVLQEWGIREVIVQVEEGNLRSAGIVKGLGWKEDGAEVVTWPEAKGGRTSSVRRWKWVRDE